MPEPLIRRSIIAATVRFYKEQFTYRASSLTFATLLAIVPLLSLVVFMATLFPSFNILTFKSEEFFFNNFVPSTADKLQDYFHFFAQQATQLPKSSGLFLVITAVMLIDTIEETLNNVWGQRQKKRSIWTLLYWGILFLSPLIMMFSITLMSYIFSLPQIVNTTKAIGISAIIFVPFLINILAFTLFYLILPSAHVKWQNSLIGGAAVAFILEVLKIGFTLYVTQFSSYELMYGAFAIIPIFLLWLYICWCVILWGALLTHALGDSKTA